MYSWIYQWCNYIMRHIEKYYGKVVALQLESGDTYSGLIDKGDENHVTLNDIVYGNKIWFFPKVEIINIEYISPSKSFIYNKK